MKTQRNILIAFFLNLAFSIFEFIGGIVTGSVAITSDAIHDIGDAASIGIAYFLEKKSKQQPDEIYTYGYARYSVVGGFITTLILVISSVAMIANAIGRIIFPTQIHYDGMILFALIGVCVNFFAAFFTRDGDSLNQKAVNLHMLEDVFGWAIVLIGAVMMRFTDFALLDPIISLGVSVFILINAIHNLKVVLSLFLEKAPCNVAEIKEHITEIPGVLDVHHIHIWSLDGVNHSATMHIVTDCDPQKVKDSIRNALRHHNIVHATLELETESEHCHAANCQVAVTECSSHCHRHRH